MSEQRDPPRWLESGYLPDELSHELAAYASRAPAEASKARMFAQLSTQLGDVALPAAQAAKPLAIAKLKLLFGSALMLAATVGLLQLAPVQRKPARPERLVSSAHDAPAPLRMAPLALTQLAASTELIEPIEPDAHTGRTHAKPARIVARASELRSRAQPRALSGAISEQRSEAPTAVERDAPAGVLQELAMLARARRALLNEPARALALSDEHARSYPRGTFEEEREVLAIEALLKLARVDEARSRGQAFQARFPRSPHVAHLAKMIAKPSEQPQTSAR